MSLAYTAIALTIVSTAATVYSQQQQAQAAEDAAKYNNAVASNQAKMREQEAAEQARRERIKQRKAMARMRVQLAANGRSTQAGTPLQILGESAANFNLGIQDAARASAAEAAGIRAEGQMGLWQADQQKKAANIKSIATIASAESSA